MEKFVIVIRLDQISFFQQKKMLSVGSSLVRFRNETYKKVGDRSYINENKKVVTEIFYSPSKKKNT